MAPKVIFLMADYGHDPTETAIPWQVFRDSGFEITFATEAGTSPKCDEKMLSGWTGTLLGANKAAKKVYKSLRDIDSGFQKPLAWKDDSFRLSDYDLVFLPGGHDKGVRQVIDSPRVHELLAAYFPQTQKPSRKSIAAICHGVQILAMASTNEGKSVLHDVQTTALPALMEQGIFYTTRLFLGDYYKTYGAGTDPVEEIVRKRLSERRQFASSIRPTPFVALDPKYNYLSARFPPDAKTLAKKAVAMVNEVTKSP
ncbi:uncharacterized protein Z518_08752 [Rhinocladiella mackenziei CBS 650.93]|uniref:DJ-1/PfpI domain-containing protein n=1 Tax=Rhinocladiella mackenziei CBS 650.93 TaxID=1442369 RepID=A0A0D2IAC0_9EURO|nr:uncharacterized protein Z518_08752 [Rhinocladiella mackenziei CBS 650.93]KIX02809.1 hypothetical protein Z518_08752 [Rhinocladiella mackenziei CBS 650.93]